MTESLDHLDLELRSLLGVVSVGIADSGDALVLQVVVRAEHASREVRSQIRRLVRANVERPMVLEVLVEGRFSASGTSPAEAG